MTSRVLPIIRWVARIASGLAALLIAVIFIGEGIADGFEPLLHLTIRENAMMVAFFIVWLGLLLGWKWELAGGVMTIGGTVAFYLLDYLFSGTFPGGPFFFILASPGLLFLYCGLRSGKEAAA